MISSRRRRSEHRRVGLATVGVRVVVVAKVVGPALLLLVPLQVVLVLLLMAVLALGLRLDLGDCALVLLGVFLIFLLFISL